MYLDGPDTQLLIVAGLCAEDAGVLSAESAHELLGITRVPRVPVDAGLALHALEGLVVVGSDVGALVHDAVFPEADGAGPRRLESLLIAGERREGTFGALCVHGDPLRIDLVDANEMGLGRLKSGIVEHGCISFLGGGAGLRLLLLIGGEVEGGDDARGLVHEGVPVHDAGLGAVDGHEDQVGVGGDEDAVDSALLLLGLAQRELGTDLEVLLLVNRGGDLDVRLEGGPIDSAQIDALALDDLRDGVVVDGLGIVGLTGDRLLAGLEDVLVAQAGGFANGLEGQLREVGADGLDSHDDSFLTAVFRTRGIAFNMGWRL